MDSSIELTLSGKIISIDAKLQEVNIQSKKTASFFYRKLQYAESSV